MKVGFRMGLAPDELAPYFRAVEDGQYMILQAPGDIRFCECDPNTDWAAWEQGVVFGEHVELRWRKRRGGRFHLVLVSQGELPAEFEDAGEAHTVERKWVYLWGERLFTPDGKPKEAWIEGRIPQLITAPRGYPVGIGKGASSDRVCLQVEILELPRPAPEDPEVFDPSPPRRWERNVRVKNASEVKDD